MTGSFRPTVHCPDDTSPVLLRSQPTRFEAERRGRLWIHWDSRASGQSAASYRLEVLQDVSGG